jgi:TolB-like protein
MSKLTSRVANFIAELQRRHVFRVTLPYLIVAIAALELAEIVQGAFGLAEGWLRFGVVAAALGLPVVAALAWVYELTPEGLRTMRELDEESGRRPSVEDAAPRLALLGVTLMAAVGAGYWWMHAGPGADAGEAGEPTPAAAPAFLPASSDSDTPIRSLAVLPLESFSAAGGQEYFANGMHEALVSRLSQLGSVRVISRTSVLSYDRTGKSMAQIAQELGVEGVVEGSVLLDGDRVRITVQLIHAPSDTHLWADDYEREMEDIIALQREVAQAIADEILGEIDARDEATRVIAAGVAPTADPEAAMWDLRGRWALSQESGDAVENAQEHFREALREDSTYAPALLGLAGSTLMMGVRDEMPSPETLAEAEDYVARAVRMVPDDQEAAELQVLIDGFRRQFDMARTIEIDIPNVTVVGAGLDSLGDRYAFLFDTTGVIPAVTEMGGRLVARLAHLRAKEHVASSRLGAARSLVAVGRVDEARKVLESAVDEFPESREAWDALEHLRVTQGDLDGVVELRRQRSRAEAEAVATSANADEMARAVARDGTRGYWTLRLQELERRAEAGERVSDVTRAQAHAALGDSASVLEHLEAAAAVRDPRLGTLPSDPMWDPYRGDPRFQAVVREVVRFRRPPEAGRRPQPPDGGGRSGRGGR